MREEDVADVCVVVVVRVSEDVTVRVVAVPLVVVVPDDVVADDVVVNVRLVPVVIVAVPEVDVGVVVAVALVAVVRDEMDVDVTVVAASVVVRSGAISASQSDDTKYDSKPGPSASTSEPPAAPLVE